MTATFASCDADPSELHVTALMTPLGTVPHALLRVSDTLVVTANIPLR